MNLNVLLIFIHTFLLMNGVCAADLGNIKAIIFDGFPPIEPTINFLNQLAKAKETPPEASWNRTID